MATRNVKTNPFDAVERLPSNTLKRHPKMELNKNDLLRLLSYLEGELQARDITIAALKAEKAKQLLYQAKYGRFGLGDPFHAMQRDSDQQKDNSFDEAAVKSMYDNQLAQLENLIATQRKAQLRMREQLAAVEKRYHKVCAELEDEKRKHAQDTAQGDDVTYMLEKERERLKQEVDFEKGQNKKLEKELKKSVTALEEERAASVKHKQVAILLIKERKKLVEKMMDGQQRVALAEKSLREEKNKMRNMAEGVAYESQKMVQMEAAVEKQISEFDMEREQLRAKLAREENHNRELEAEIERLHQQLEILSKQAGSERRGEGPQSIEIKSSVSSRGSAKEMGIPSGAPTPEPRHKGPAGGGPKVYKNTPPNTPPEARRIPVVNLHQSPERDSSSPRPDGDIGVKRAFLNYSSPAKSPERTGVLEKLTPAEKPSEATSHVNVIASSGATVFTTPSGGTTVFTTPSGTRISLNVGPPSSNLPRKTSPVGRGTPPPVPPNKPAYVPQAAPRKDIVARPSSARSDPGSGTGKPQPPTKFGITISKDKITISSPDSPNENTRQMGGAHQRPLMATGQAATTAVASGDGAAVRKPSQSATTPSSSETFDSSPSASPNLDFFGPEMADLQQLLVSMVTGSSEGSSSSVDSCEFSSPISPSDVHTSPLHKYATCGDSTELQKLIANDLNSINDTAKDGSTALHYAAENGRKECLRILLENGGDANALRNDQTSPLHVAAGEGHVSCLKLLLGHKGDVHLADNAGWTPLYWAATNGHTHCCRVLLDFGARIDAINNANWTPLHGTIHSGHIECLEQLLTYRGPPSLGKAEQTARAQWHASLVNDVVNLPDKDGWTIAHLAAIRDTKDCLELLAQHCDLDLERRDKWGRTVLEVSSKACRQFLEDMDDNNEKTCTVCIEVNQDNNGNINNVTDPLFTVAVIKVTQNMTWSELEQRLASLLTTHFVELSLGLKTKKTSRFDLDSPDTNTPYSLGLGLDSVKHYSIGTYQWILGSVCDTSPFDILCENDTRRITISLVGQEIGCQDGLAYETLFSISTLQNYLRLVEQYRNVIFYGPGGASKTYLARKLAQCVQGKEIQNGNHSDLHLVTFNTTYSRTDLLLLLLEKRCLLPTTTPVPEGLAPVLVFDDLSKISFSQVFADVLPIIENRGPENAVRIQLEENREAESFYLLSTCYIIGTMDRTRSTGLDLSIQQRFRWVQFRNDIEPTRNLLQRHLYRKLLHRYHGFLPSGDDSVYRAVEWVICVWQRLNDGLGKLGLPEIVFGPSHFLSCPIEVGKAKSIFKWLSLLWNHVIAPAVSDAVIRGSGSDTSTGGQQKVANTALYVLMQRAIVSGCPLSGQEKERYLSSFHGSNELDIKMRGEKRDNHAALDNHGASPAVLAFLNDSGDEGPRDPPCKKPCPGGGVLPAVVSSPLPQNSFPELDDIPVKETSAANLKSPVNHNPVPVQVPENGLVSKESIPRPMTLVDRKNKPLERASPNRDRSRVPRPNILKNTPANNNNSKTTFQKAESPGSQGPRLATIAARGLSPKLATQVLPIPVPCPSLSGLGLQRSGSPVCGAQRSGSPATGLNRASSPASAKLDKAKTGPVNQQLKKEYLREIASPTVVSPTRLKKFSEDSESTKKS